MAEDTFRERPSANADNDVDIRVSCSDRTVVPIEELEVPSKRLGCVYITSDAMHDLVISPRISICFIT